MLRPRPIAAEAVRPLLVRALAEDLGHGDVTTHALDIRGPAEARLIAQAPGIVAGLPLLEPLFSLLDSRVRVRLKIKDGRPVRPAQVLAELEGPASALLAGERTVLNLLTHCSGIATLTHHFVKAVRGSRAQVFDTRKTLPGLRDLEKYAVAMGGGRNHRFGLYDQVLIKNNHLACLGDGEAGVARALDEAKRRARPWTLIEIEARTLAEALEAARSGADIVLLDNFKPGALARVVRAIRARYPTKPLLEASGGVSLKTVGAFARAGVDRISVGALTHSAPALPMALRLSRP